MNAISLVIDRWHAGYLGCYGNPWIATPHLDRLASEGHVFDQATIDSPGLKSLYRSYWRGLHALAATELESSCTLLPQRLCAAGIQTTLLTDDPSIAGLCLAAEFDEIIRVDGMTNTRPAGDTSETRMAQLMAAALDWLASAEQPFLLWIHAQGMAGPWDAPLEFRAQYADDDGPPPYQDVAPPSRCLPVDFDPDDVLPIRWAYAGQATVLDQCIGGLTDALREGKRWDDTLLAIVGARGFPLGEHRRIGADEGERATENAGLIELPHVLYEELIHVPWLIRMPGDVTAPARNLALVQPADLNATLLDAFGIGSSSPSGQGRTLLPFMRDEQHDVRDRACCLGPSGERSLRTRSWQMRWNAQDGLQANDATDIELFVKPDDRWEVNDVADRCFELVQPLQEVFLACQQWHSQTRTDDLPPLPESIATVPD